ncbi:MAG: hypothetical protein IKF90_19810 [Parasporobacterium sp.]|nr:hypothetical protein [Parasporobacterium sp.]
MPGRRAIKEQILKQLGRAQEAASSVRQAADLTEEDVQEHVHRYVCYKFLLDPEESRGLSITAMANKSIERAVELKIPIAKEGEKATTCGAAGSSAMKVALLLNAIKKDFQVEIEPHRLGFARDTNEIGSLVYQAIRNYSE